MAESLAAGPPARNQMQNLQRRPLLFERHCISQTKSNDSPQYRIYEWSLLTCGELYEECTEHQATEIRWLELFWSS